MYLKSLYPPVPSTPDVNFHELLFTSPLPVPIPEYTLHIDGLTGRSRTRNEFYEEVRDGATALATPTQQGGLGLSSENGDVVAIYSTNSLEYMTLIHACLVIGVPFTLLSAFYTPYELAHAVKTTKPSRIFAHPSLLGKVETAAKDIGLPSQRIYLLEGTAPGKESFAGVLQQVRARTLARVPVKPVKKDSIAYLMFSSGTGGLPKAVMISHGNLAFTLAALVVYVKEEMKLNASPTPPPHLTWVAALPFHHSYGLHMFCLRGFIFPTTFVILPRWDTEQVLDAIPRYRVSMLPLVPSVAHQLVFSKKFANADLSSITNVLCGAAALPPVVRKKLSGLTKSAIAEGYGITEATLSACLQPAPGVIPGVEPVLGSCGILLPGMEARILREDGSDADVNEPGELWLRGRNVAMGYYNNEQATKETFVDGWLRTGDSLRANANGTFFFVDRLKDTLKISGAQVSPTEIEDVLRSHPSGFILDVSVAGVPGTRSEDEKVPRAWIVLSDEGKRIGEHVVAKELDEWVKTNLSSFKWLRGGIEVVDEIPKLSTGKVLRRALQQKYVEQRVPHKL
ncbi:hypothetical protein BXZ70DRAFT_904699 [Cristinia sonorae]|uniref:Acetyl-CoA synthetase-like protein n=1 Tax=Cristinia sonorae TaxID=1940300 RepID=A0A8K0XSY8_9AGAR|nr:hypothetical protein BXZ70DRAFT_904699 [Cristinia sonorae]